MTRAATELAQIRGVLAEKVVMSSALDPFLPLKALKDYAGISVRTLRDYLADSTHPLPHYRLPGGGKILVRRSEFDAWILEYRQTGPVDVLKIADEILGQQRRR